jgi:hypothetical protein
LRGGLLSALLPDQDEDACDEGQDTRHYDRYPYRGDKRDDTDEDQINGEQEHADVFGYHSAMVTGVKGLSRAKVGEARRRATGIPKAPNPKLQAPEKQQAPSSKRERAREVFDVWNSSVLGCWSLELSEGQPTLGDG